LGEDRIQHLHQRAGVRLARRARRKARVGGEVWATDRGQEPAPLPQLIEQREDVSEVLVCYVLRVYESPSTLQLNRVTS
jgi:hypothetical protein